MATEKRLIYMDDTMDKLRAYAERKHYAGHVELANGILKAVNYIRNNIVRADAVEVVHGRWDKNWSEDNIVYCNQCYMAQDMPTPYCHSCGAQMDGGKDND